MTKMKNMTIVTDHCDSYHSHHNNNPFLAIGSVFWIYSVSLSSCKAGAADKAASQD